MVVGALRAHCGDFTAGIGSSSATHSKQRRDISNVHPFSGRGVITAAVLATIEANIPTDAIPGFLTYEFLLCLLCFFVAILFGFGLSTRAVVSES